MGSLLLGYAGCVDCHGRGKDENGALCPRCKGAGIVAVYAYEPGDPENPEVVPARRRFRRHLTELPITITLADRTLEGCCNQIAEGGMGALLPEPVQAGSRLMLHFTVPTRPTEMQLWAVVRYQMGLQHGMEFVSSTEADRTSIRQFCSELPSVGVEF